MSKHPFHPVADLLPLMDEVDLAADTKANAITIIRPTADLVARIQAEHEAAQSAIRSGFNHAAEAGRLLMEAKKLVGHGGWLGWLEENCGFSERTAQGYMRLARLEPANAQRVADLSLRDALKAVAKPREVQAAEVEPPPRPREPRQLALHEAVSLEQWKDFSSEERRRLLPPDQVSVVNGFNRQVNDSIDWAHWSWNPISGCLHDCSYCYARDIATLGPTSSGFPHGFQPTLYPRRLLAPSHTKPRDASTDWRERNVFTGSMTDLWGRWVPDEWIEAVLDACRDAPQWTFLFLTKFPQRMAEFSLPPNGWYGTTVDLQDRVKNAERAFAKVRAKSPDARCWLSVEPMLDPLKFKRLDLFSWIVIGGASKSSKTPKWQPPFEWIVDLHGQARAAGCWVWHKENLLGSRVREMMDGLPVPQDPQEAPEVFRYLGRQTKRAA